MQEYYVKGLGVGIETYDQEQLKKTKLTSDSGTRLWWFQVCTEVAYFQVAPANDSIRSPQVDSRHVYAYLFYQTTLFPFFSDFFYLIKLSDYLCQVPFGPLQECLWGRNLSRCKRNKFVLWRHTNWW